MVRRSTKFLLLLAASLMLLFTGCTVVQENITPEEQSTISLSRIQNTYAGADPIEPFNRSMFAVTDFCMSYILDPLGRVYCTILPRPVIECIDNACINLEFPARAVSCLLRAEWGGALDETVRFFVNTIVGIAGFFDPAKHWLHIYSTESNFGQAFATWGIAPGCTFILPFSSAANVRDTVGLLFDMAFDCKTYIPYCGWATGLNRAIMAQDKYSSAFDGMRDPYKGFTAYSVLSNEMGRQLWGYRYRNALWDEWKKRAQEQNCDEPEPAPLEPEIPVSKPKWAQQTRWVGLNGYYGVNPVTDSLRSVLFKEQNRNSFWYMPLSLFCQDFICDRCVYKIKEQNRTMRYAFWDAPEVEENQTVPPEKLVILLPGIGGTYMDSSPVAFAELFHKQQAKVVVINSTFSWQFHEGRTDGELPGFLPVDAAELRRVIKRVLADLKEREKIKSPELVLAGYSFGAMHTLKIADLEFEDEEIGFSRYVAINPPVSLKNAVKAADTLASKGAGLTDKDIKENFIDAAGRIMAASNLQLPPYAPGGKRDIRLYRIDIPERESSVLVGLNLRNSMRELLLSAHGEKPLAGIKNSAEKIRKNNLYLELDRVTFKTYAEKILASRYDDVPLERLYGMSDLRSIASTLAHDGRVLVFHNFDDFLLTPGDRKFLSDTLGSRLTWFTRGGHLGNLYVKQVQDMISEAVVSGAKSKKDIPAKERLLPHNIKKTRPMK